MHDEQKEKIYSAFIKWYASPVDSRKPRTIEEWCTQFNIPTNLVGEFTHKREFTDDIYREAIAWGKSKIPELLHILYQQYLITKAPATLKLYKEIISSEKQDKKLDAQESSRQGILRELFQASNK